MCHISITPLGAGLWESPGANPIAAGYSGHLVVPSNGYLLTGIKKYFNTSVTGTATLRCAGMTPRTATSTTLLFRGRNTHRRGQSQNSHRKMVRETLD